MTVLVMMITMFSSMCSAKNVTVQGQGASEVTAKNDALRCAVEDAVGFMVDARTWIENAALVEDKVVTRSKGYITSYKILNKYKDGDRWKVTVNAEVVDDPSKVKELMSTLTKEGLIKDYLGNPRIAVIMQTEDKVRATGAEVEIIRGFKAAGFNNMVACDSVQQSNDLAALAQSLEADILIVGSVVNEELGDVGRYLKHNRATNIMSCRTHINAEMYYAKTGRLVATEGRNASAVDISSDTALQKAEQKVGKEIGEHFAEQLLILGARLEKYM